VRCNDADSNASHSAPLKNKEERRRNTGSRRNAGLRKGNEGPKGKDDWRALMKGGDVDFKDEEPDFSEEGWARRYPKKK
jgi:ATP-dependent RNA helicase DeaD